MSSHTLRRNTIILNALESRAGVFSTRAQIIAHVADHYGVRAVDDGLAQLVVLGYLDREGDSYARRVDSCSLRERAHRKANLHDVRALVRGSVGA